MRSFLLILMIWITLSSCRDKTRSEREVHKDEKILSDAPRHDCATTSNFLDGMEVFPIVEKMPEYNGGMGNYYELIGKEIKTHEDKATGQSITVVFIVDTLGRVRNECILDRHLGNPLTDVEKQALKAVKNNQSWTPGYQKGQKVPVRMILKLSVGHRG